MCARDLAASPFLSPLPDKVWHGRYPMGPMGLPVNKSLKTALERDWPEGEVETETETETVRLSEWSPVWLNLVKPNERKLLELAEGEKTMRSILLGASQTSQKATSQFIDELAEGGGGGDDYGEDD